MRSSMFLFSILSLAVILGFASMAVFIIRDRSFDDYDTVPKRKHPKIMDGKVKIGIVGDSWVADNKLDQSVLDAMSASGVQAEVVSSGEPGAVSRQIYRNLISESTSRILPDIS